MLTRISVHPKSLHLGVRLVLVYNNNIPSGFLQSFWLNNYLGCKNLVVEFCLFCSLDNCMLSVLLMDATFSRELHGEGPTKCTKMNV